MKISALILLIVALCVATTNAEDNKAVQVKPPRAVMAVEGSAKKSKKTGQLKAALEKAPTGAAVQVKPPRAVMAVEGSGKKSKLT